jgi:TM2 domain-containing membrane protein YozV
MASFVPPIICPNCGQENVAGSRFCFKCGTPLQATNAQLQVPDAHYAAPPLAYPPQYAMPPQACPFPYVMPSSDKKKRIAILFCCLGFLGLAGLHRLYVGKIFTGILYLCTFGFITLGTIYDLILLLMGQFADRVGQPLRI